MILPHHLISNNDSEADNDDRPGQASIIDDQLFERLNTLSSQLESAVELSSHLYRFDRAIIEGSEFEFGAT
jgi:hypothetical protein